MTWNPILDNAASIIAAILVSGSITRGSRPQLAIEAWEECRKQLLAKYPNEVEADDE